MAPTDREAVARLIGREPMGHFQVVVRRTDGSPVVIENAPLLDDGRPMPTRYWLADRTLCRVIGQLEADGGVDRAESEVGPVALAELHRRHGTERDALLPANHVGPTPSGGVGGTRIGVKCLHAHYAHHLVGADDPVGRWVHDQLEERGVAFDPDEPGVMSAWS